MVASSELFASLTAETVATAATAPPPSASAPTMATAINGIGKADPQAREYRTCHPSG
jgi:hypothetical protein